MTHRYNYYLKKEWERIEKMTIKENTYVENSILSDIQDIFEKLNSFTLRRILSEYTKYFSLDKPKLLNRHKIIDYMLTEKEIFGKPGLVDFVADMVKSGLIDLKEGDSQ